MASPLSLDISNISYKVSSTLGTQAASLDIEQAYHNSTIALVHKPYLAILWNDTVYVGHVMMEGLATARGIQGCPADAHTMTPWDQTHFQIRH